MKKLENGITTVNHTEDWHNISDISTFCHPQNDTPWGRPTPL